jgi:hypothetical protein
MLDALAKAIPDIEEFDREAAIYWFASDYHGPAWDRAVGCLAERQR